MKEKKLITDFMNVYCYVLKNFYYDDDYYIISVNYDEKGLFSLNIFNDTKKINAFHKSFILDLKSAINLKNMIRYDFINNQDIYLPYIYTNYDKKSHVLKNYKFILEVDILEHDIIDTEKIQKKALKKMMRN